jgi:hypothetical protein
VQVRLNSVRGGIFSDYRIESIGFNMHGNVPVAVLTGIPRMVHCGPSTNNSISQSFHVVETGLYCSTTLVQYRDALVQVQRFPHVELDPTLLSAWQCQSLSAPSASTSL